MMTNNMMNSGDKIQKIMENDGTLMKMKDFMETDGK